MRRFEAWAVLGVSFQSVVPLYATTNERPRHGFSTGKKIPVRKPVVAQRGAPQRRAGARQLRLSTKDTKDTKNGNCFLGLSAAAFSR